MGDLIEKFMKTKVTPPAYRRIQNFLAKVSSLPLPLSFRSLYFYICFFVIDFIWIFSSQVGVSRTRPNTKPKNHTGINPLFVDVPENLRVPSISASSSEISQWNTRSSNYFEVLFAFASANLHDDGVLVFTHATDPEVSRLIHNWAHIEEFYVTEDWFGMNDLVFQSPTNPSELEMHFWFFFLLALFLSFMYS